MNIPNIRLLNQQLLNPLFREPKELVSWMGAMQAQNYSHGEVGSRDASEIGYNSNSREGVA